MELVVTRMEAVAAGPERSTCDAYLAQADGELSFQE